MFEPKHLSSEKLVHYIGARVTEAEDEWLCEEMERRKMTMSDLIRLALGKLQAASRNEGRGSQRALRMVVEALGKGRPPERTEAK